MNSIETDTHVFHPKPRISAAKLAEYIVAEPARQKAIVRDAQKAPKVIMICYKRVRGAIKSAFSKDGLSAAHLLEQAELCKVASASSDWAKDDNKRSATALEHLAKITSEIDFSDATLIPRPGNSWGGLMIGGVKVSINPELVFSIRQRNITKVGGIILNTGMSESHSLEKGGGKFCAGDYLAALEYRMLERHINVLGLPLHSKCYAIDVFRRQVYTAPTAMITINKNIDAACETIALRWEKIPIDIEAEI